MEQTFKGRHGTTFTYAPDLSGEVTVSLVGLEPKAVDGTAISGLIISGLDLLEFVAHWIRETRIAALESADPATVLGVRKQDMPLWSAPAKTPLNGPMAPPPAAKAPAPGSESTPEGVITSPAPGPGATVAPEPKNGAERALDAITAAKPPLLPERAKPVVNPAPGNAGCTEKQVAFYCRLLESHVFTEAERKRAYDWLATRATRQLIKDQIDWLKRQVELRHAEEKQRKDFA
jgi:hypothetical protein